MMSHHLRPIGTVIFIALLVAATAMSPAPSFASTASGRAALWTYLRDDSVDHVQIVPLLSFNIRQIAKSALSTEVTLRGYADFRNGASANEAVRIHRALLVYKPAKGQWEVRAGQQWLTEGVGRGNVAGLWARYVPSSMYYLTAYGGARLPQSISLDEAVPNEGVSFGLNLQRRCPRRQVGLSYFYVTKGGEVMYQGAGLDASLKPTAEFSTRLRFHMNLEQQTIETAELTAGWAARENLFVSAALRNHAPRVFEDSFFARFLEQASTNSARASAKWTFYRALYASGSATTVFTEEDLLYKTRLGIGIPEVEVGYTHWLSAGKGDMDGFYGQAIYELREAVNVLAGFDYSRGSNSEIRPNTESQSEWLGATWSAVSAFSLGVRAEHLKDVSRSEDWRALISMSSQFSVKR